MINKQTIIENRKIMLSKEFASVKLHEMRTSGSTGIPFVIQQDPGKRLRCIAELKAMNYVNNYKSHEKMLFIVSDVKKKKISRRKEFFENIYRMHIGKNDDENIKKIVDFIIQKKPIALHASASNIPPILDYIENYNIPRKKIRLKTVITTGEMVPISLRNRIKSVFGDNCVVSVKYANEENGVLAQDNNENGPYYLNISNYKFEILQFDNDLPCSENELGRIVITDLYNKAIPMIRYDTGDIGTISKKNGKLVLNNLSGKRRDLIFDTKGTSISGATFTNLLKDLKNVRMWQFIQVSKKDYELKIVSEDECNLSENDILLNELHNLLGEDAFIKVTYTDEIPTIISGKRRYTINLYKPQ